MDDLRGEVQKILAGRTDGGGSVDPFNERNEWEDAKRSGKAAILAQLRSDYASLRDSEWGGDTRFDQWFAADLNNARLLSFGLYDQWVPAFECLYQRSNGWADFHQRVAALGALAPDARTAALEQQCGN